MLDKVGGVDPADLSQRANNPSLDIVAFPMFRLPKDKWNQFYGGYDIYNRLVEHIKTRRDSYLRLYRLDKQKKQKEDPKNKAGLNFNVNTYRL